MDVNEFIKILGYNESKTYLSKSKFNKYPRYAHTFRKAQKECSLQGVYTLGGENVGTIIPVVYVCEAATEEDATIIHKRVWNQNTVPFLFVSTPKTIRLYPGFKYSIQPENNESQAIFNIAKTANEVLKYLSDFKANQIDIGYVWKKWGQEVTIEDRVDRKLLNSLKILGEQLIKNGLPRNLAHPLIGKYVYLNYLRDRDILSDRKFEQWEIDPESVFGRNVTLQGFFSIIEKLDSWLNGELFPIPDNGNNLLRLEHFQKVAATFAGDDPITGQMSLFKTYDFKNIPTETLSVVYQQFLHQEGRERSQGAYYTPVHLVNFILDELDSKQHLQSGMTVFDPACGSGAFLVQCYRLIIERELSKMPEARLQPTKLRELLTHHIYGIDVDEDACGVTELSLTLTLLDYVDPPDLEKPSYKRFKLPVLRNRNIFYSEMGFFKPNLDFEKFKPKDGFDWIVGNPPWKKLKNQSDDSSDKAVLEWIGRHSKQFPVSDNQVAEAFAWGVTEYVSKEGLIGLLMPASSLFKTKGESYRKQFFRQTNVWCVVNFSNLRHLLFEGAVNPAAAFFYSLDNAENETYSRIVSYAPFVVNQLIGSDTNKRGKTKLWTVTVDSGEIREILRNDVISGKSIPWKLAMWGSFRDKHLLSSIEKMFPLLSEFKRNHDLSIHPGLELRNSNIVKEPVEYIPEVIGKSEIDMSELRGCGKIFSFPSNSLKIIEEERAYVRKGRGIKPLSICHPPHIIVDAARRFAVFSDKFIAVPPRQIGIAGKPSKKNILKALTLYLNSEFVQYQQFMTSTFWGIERDRPDKKDLEKIPIPIDSLSDKELKSWASLYDDIVNEENEMRQDNIKLFVKEKNGVRLQKLMNDLNEAVYDLLKLSAAERWIVEDLLLVRMKLNEGKIAQEAVQAANLAEIQTYSEILKSELDSFLDNEILDQHKVSAYFSDQLTMIRIDHPKCPPAGPVTVLKVSDSKIEKEFSRLKHNLSHRQGQWIYFEKNLKYYEGRTTYFFKTNQRLNWLKSQALLDADEFIAEKLC